MARPRYLQRIILYFIFSNHNSVLCVAVPQFIYCLLAGVGYSNDKNHDGRI